MIEIEILKKEKTPHNVIDHSIAVCKKACEIAENFPEADLDIIQKGALLHDIGRSRTHGITHAVEGVKIAREYGYGDDVLNVIERHIGAGITKKEATASRMCAADKIYALESSGSSKQACSSAV